MDYENVDIDSLDKLSTRSLRELALHDAGVKLLSKEDHDFILGKLAAIQERIHPDAV